ncbi:hypothetical protein D3C74_329080 [compost metagenome]
MIYKEIHPYLYNLLLGLKRNDDPNDNIFTLSYGSLNDMIIRLCKKAGLNPQRNLSFHSLRKSGVRLVDEMTNGDKVAIMSQGGWSSFDVGYKSYIGQERKVNLAGIAMFEDINESVFEELTQEEMLGLLKSFGNGFGILLRREAQKIINKR